MSKLPSKICVVEIHWGIILDNEKIFNITSSINKIIKIKDPTNVILEKWKRPNGLNISKISIGIFVRYHHGYIVTLIFGIEYYTP